MAAHFVKRRRAMRAGLVPVRRKCTAHSARWLLEHALQNQSGLPSLAQFGHAVWKLGCAFFSPAKS
jgi:hypothetical protein